MAEYTATVQWERQDATFTDNQYSRAHRWIFDGGLEIPASSSPHVVALPYSNPTNVDPEEAFVAALASCHMLWALSIAAKQQFLVERYTDAAVGVMERNAAGRLAITRVTLRPEMVFGGPRLPTEAQIAQIHRLAHENCYIANSVTTEVIVEPVPQQR